MVQGPQFPPLKGEGVDSDLRPITTAEEQDPWLKAVEGSLMLEKVAARLTGADLRTLTESSQQDRAGPAISAEQVLFANRRVVPDQVWGRTEIHFLHPDRRVAAEVANLMAEESVADWNRQQGQIDQLRQDLSTAVGEQESKIKDLANALRAFEGKYATGATQGGPFGDGLELRADNAMEIQAKSKLAEAEARQQQLETWRKSGREMQLLPLIANQGLVAGLAQDIVVKRKEIEQLQERTSNLEPTTARATTVAMGAAQRSLAQLEAQLQQAAASTAAAIETEAENARRNLAETEARSQVVKESLQEMDRLRAEHEGLQRQLEAGQAALKRLHEDLDRISNPTDNEGGLGRLASTKQIKARVVGIAVPPAEGEYFSPNVFREIGLGLLRAFGWAAVVAVVVGAIGWWVERGGVA